MPATPGQPAGHTPGGHLPEGHLPAEAVAGASGGDFEQDTAHNTVSNIVKDLESS